jgi:CheY-like chemotaxis protein
MHNRDDVRQQPISVLLVWQTSSSADGALDRSMRSWHRLAAHLTPFVGDTEFCALYGRTVRLACPDFEWLAAVLLIDIGLPGMDGYELGRRLRALPETQRSVLIALTGYGQDQDREQPVAAGFDFHLLKPADETELIAILDELSRSMLAASSNISGAS